MAPAPGIFLVWLAAVPAPSPSPWSALAERDLRAVHETILRDHPGPVDPLNPAFAAVLEEGFREGLAAAPRVDSFGSYSALLRRYVVGFRDGHLGLNFRVAWNDARWPGFLVMLRGGRFALTQVSTSDPALPPNGSELVDCDGVAPAPMLERDVLPFFGNPSLEAHRVTLTPLLLVDVGLPRDSKPKACRVRVGNTIQTVTLRDRFIRAEELTQRRLAAAFGPSPAFGVRRFARDSVWVSIPSFNNSDDNIRALQDIVAHAPEWRAAPNVVFDLRGNNGGNSNWGDRIAEALWGERFVKVRIAAIRARLIEWRASEENRKYWQEMSTGLAAKLGDDAREAVWAKEITARLGKALEARQPFAREDTAPVATGGTVLGSAFSGRAVLLTDGRCFSACLVFADLLLALPNVIHVGQTTDADSVYMEARTVGLPSGLATLVIPTKVHRGRKRGTNVPPVPAHRFDGDISDTQRVEQWLMTIAAGRPR